MPSNWQNQPNRVPLPPDWEQRRIRCREAAGGRCQHLFPNGGRCREPGAECDHIVPRTQGGDSEPGNLAWLCERHHKIKSQRESADSRRAIAAKAHHPVEQVPMRRT